MLAVCSCCPSRRPPLCCDCSSSSSHINTHSTLIVTEECLLDPSRNPQLGKEGIEQLLKDYLGLDKVIWLWKGMAGAVTRERAPVTRGATGPGGGGGRDSSACGKVVWSGRFVKNSTSSRVLFLVGTALM